MHAKCRYIDIALILAESQLEVALEKVASDEIKGPASLPLDPDCPLAQVCRICTQIAGGDWRDWWGYFANEMLGHRDRRARLFISRGLQLTGSEGLRAFWRADADLGLLTGDAMHIDPPAASQAGRAIRGVSDVQIQTLRHNDTNDQFFDLAEQVLDLKLPGAAGDEIELYVIEYRGRQDPPWAAMEPDDPVLGWERAAEGLTESQRQVLVALFNNATSGAATASTVYRNYGVPLSESTIRNSLNKLRGGGFVEKVGVRKGYQISDRGKRCAREIKRNLKLSLAR